MSVVPNSIHSGAVNADFVACAMKLMVVLARCKAIQADVFGEVVQLVFDGAAIGGLVVEAAMPPLTQVVDTALVQRALLDVLPAYLLPTERDVAKRLLLDYDGLNAAMRV